MDSELLPAAIANTPASAFARRSGLAPGNSICCRLMLLANAVTAADEDASANSVHSCRGGASFRSMKSSEGASPSDARPPTPCIRRIGLVERMRAACRSGVSVADEADAGLALVEFWRPLFADEPPLEPVAVPDADAVPVPVPPEGLCERRSFARVSLCAGFSSLAVRSSASAAARSSSDAPPNSGQYGYNPS